MPDRELTWLRRLHHLSTALAREPDLDQLLTRILESAVELTDAERGFLVRIQTREGGGRQIKVEVALGFDGEALSGPEEKVSRTVVRRVLDEDRSVVTAREEDGDIVDISSVRSQRVRSIVCVPLRLRGEIIGVLYLDNRRDEAFTDRDLPCLEAFCDHAALTLETAELHGDRAAEDQQLNQTLRDIDGLRRPGVPDSLPPVDRIPRFGRLVGGSVLRLWLYRHIERAARGDAPVLIVGENGVGKARIALEIHARSARQSTPFETQACAGATPELLSNELWGTGRGILSGILEPHPGAFERAGAGTLHLSDLADLSPDHQLKLVNVLRSKTTIPVGDETPRPVASRLIVSTRHDPEALMLSGALREDLCCLLELERIDVPPLREHAEDIPALLANLFSAKRPTLTVSSAALDQLVDYAWPGNVRELENLALRLVATEGDTVDVEHLPPEIQTKTASDSKTLREVRRELIQAALQETGGSRARAARRLAIPRSSLYRLLEEFGLQ